MTVDADFCLRFLREVRDVAFATVDEDGLPAVRVIDVMMVEGGRLYFVAARGKAFYGQVMRTRYVAIVGQSPDYRTCRLRGPVEHPDDPAEQRRLVDRVFELNPSMEELYPGDSRYVLEAFYLERGQGEFFDLGRHPLFRAPFALGGGPVAREGFTVSDACTGCGACANKAVCPQTIIRMVPREATNFIPCSSTEEDDELTRRICGHGCISCGECERACPEGAVSIVNNHAVIDYDKCAGCVACTVKCRKKIIVDTLHDLTKVKEKVAFVKCSGGYKASEVYKKMGLTSCEEAIEKISPKDHELCTTGCCGLGSCTKVCRYDAIHVVNGTAVVDPEKCVGCKDCTYACPKHIITIVPYTGQKQVPCSSTADYEDKAKVCWSSCIACEDCVNNCPNGAIYMEDKHAVIDHELCENCNVCQYVCSRRIIKEMEVPEYTYLQREALGIRKGE